MKLRIFFSSVAILFIISLTSCGGGSGSMSELLAQRDSLIRLTDHQTQQLEVYQTAVNTINSAVDSISKQEGMLFVSLPSDGEGGYSKDAAIRDLERYETVLKRQHEKINELNNALKANKGGEELNGMIEIMQQQLKSKDALIAQLRKQLNEKDVNIARLRHTITAQQTEINAKGEEIETLGQRINAKDKALKAQDKIINQCYVIIASKSELKNKGIIRKGKLQPEAMLNKSVMMKVDIRKAKEFSFSAKKPRILTNMPSSSYNLTTNGNGNFILNITNPSAFWSISNVLVIQTD